MAPYIYTGLTNAKDSSHMEEQQKSLIKSFYNTQNSLTIWSANRTVVQHYSGIISIKHVILLSVKCL